MVKQLIVILLYVTLFPINIKLKKCVRELFLKTFFLIAYCPDKYITQKMCDEVVDGSLAALELIPNWFPIIKIIKKFFLLCM